MITEKMIRQRFVAHRDGLLNYIRGSGTDRFVDARAELIAPILPRNLFDAISNLRQSSCFVTHVFMNARDYADIRKFGRDEVDFEVSFLGEGLMGTLLFGEIFLGVHREVPVGVIYFVSDLDAEGIPKYVGVAHVTR